jgi:hypothetical protein
MPAPTLRTSGAALALAFALIPATATPQATMRHLDGPADARGCATQAFSAMSHGVVLSLAQNRAERRWHDAVFARGYARAFHMWENGIVHAAWCILCSPLHRTVSSCV